MASQPSIDATLARVGNGIITDGSSIIAGTGLYGIYVVLICLSTYSIMRKNWRRPTAASIVLLAGTLTMFGISTYLWAVNVAVLNKRIRLALVDYNIGPISQRLSLANTTTARIRYSTDFMFIFEYLIGDAIIAWRVFVLYRWSLLVIAPLVTIWIGTLVTGFGLLGCIVHSDFALGAQLPKLCEDLENSSWTISLAFNAVATVLMALVALKRRNEAHMPNFSGPRRARSKIDRVLTILVASGTVYFILGAMRLTAFANTSLNPLPSKVTFANEIIEFMLNQLVGIYPTAVTAFVLNEQSIFGSGMSSTFLGPTSAAPSQSIHFQTRDTEESPTRHDTNIESELEKSPTSHDTNISDLEKV